MTPAGFLGRKGKTKMAKEDSKSCFNPEELDGEDSHGEPVCTQSMDVKMSLLRREMLCAP